MSIADLRRLIARATPRVEDNRTPDRLDILRKEHGHLSLREMVDALDALEFSATAFVEIMQEHLNTTADTEAATAAAATVAAKEGGEEEAEAPAEKKKPQVDTAVHGLFRAMDSLRFISPGLAAPPSSGVPAASGEEEAAEDAALPEAAAEARQRGGARFKDKDFDGAVEEYTTAIQATLRGAADLHTLYSNRSAAQAKRPGADLTAALKDARRCVELAPEWPKGRFREGTCLREMGFLTESTAAFRAGERLEPENKDWPKEVEATEKLRRATPPALARQLLFNMLPELLVAWTRGAEGAAPGGVLQVQARGDFKELGAPKWQLLRDTKSQAKAQLRIAYLTKKDYLANLAANVQSPPDGVASVDIDGQAMKIAEVVNFMPPDGSDLAAIHIDVQDADKKMSAVLCLVHCGEDIRRSYLGVRKDPVAPKGTVESVLDLQKKTGFPKGLPRLLGFQQFPGDLNFPVIDLQRDMPSAIP